MARYIDAEMFKQIVIDASQQNNTPIFGEFVAKLIDLIPTADVAPRADVDLYRRLNDELEDELAVTYDKLENAKSEIAREIFAEIEREFSGAYWYKGYTIERYIAELKKKYLEETNDGQSCT